ncbi:MAG: hypothetical protein Q8Q36_02995 [bacterium]|nr:hypothetical protein [bacterium]
MSVHRFPRRVDLLQEIVEILEPFCGDDAPLELSGTSKEARMKVWDFLWRYNHRTYAFVDLLPEQDFEKRLGVFFLRREEAAAATHAAFVSVFGDSYTRKSEPARKKVLSALVSPEAKFFPRAQVAQAERFLWVWREEVMKKKIFSLERAEPKKVHAKQAANV